MAKQFLRSYVYHLPHTVEEALVLLREEAMVLAGGTDLLLKIPPHHSPLTIYYSPLSLVDITDIRELKCISLRDGHIRLGALTTFSDLLRSELIDQEAPLLKYGAGAFASPQLRSQATLVGNAINASPAGDGLTCLFALGASFIVRNEIREREVHVEELVVGPGVTSLRPGELVTAILIPRLGPGWGFHFIKHAHRSSLAIAIVSAVAGVRLSPDGSIADLRLSVGAVSPTPLRLQALEDELKGLDPNDRRISLGLDKVRGLISPIDDIRASAWYRREVTPVILRRAFEKAVEKARVINQGLRFGVSNQGSVIRNWSSEQF